jgi:hypothetical protein
LQLDLKYENARQFYIKIPASELDGRELPPIFTNVIQRKNNIECQTLELMKRNQKVAKFALLLSCCSQMTIDQRFASGSHSHECVLYLSIFVIYSQ